MTIRYVGRGGTPGAHYARDSRPLLADRDLYGVGQAGDVAVFDVGGAAGTSVMGNLSALLAVRLGIAGCIVDGGVRDIASIRTTGPHRVGVVAGLRSPVAIALKLSRSMAPLRYAALR